MPGRRDLRRAGEVGLDVKHHPRVLRPEAVAMEEGLEIAEQEARAAAPPRAGGRSPTRAPGGSPR